MGRLSLQHRDSLQPAKVDNRTDALEKEIIELKAANANILEALRSMSQKIDLLIEYRNENKALTTENKRLVTENIQLNCELKKVSLKNSSAERTGSILSTGENAARSFNVDDSNLNECSLNFVSANELSAANSLRWIYVSNLKSTTTCEDVRTHIMNKTHVGREEIHCNNLTPKSMINPFYTSFKVGFIENSSLDLSDASFWPSNAVVREFVQERKQNFHEARKRQPSL